MNVARVVMFLGSADAHAIAQQCLHGYDVIRVVAPEAADQLLPSADVVLDAYMGIPFTAERLQKAQRLRLFVTATTGSSHIDTSALTARSIPLLTLAGRRDVLNDITAAAEHSWLLLLACARHLRAATEHVLQGQWDRNLFPGVMLRGRTLGLVGCGRIGEWMSRYGVAFGMKVIGYDPHVSDWPRSIERATLDEVVSNCDFLSVHVPLNDETRGLLDRSHVQALRKGAVVINTSRGDVIDEAAVLEALQDGRLAAFGADVLTTEPEIRTSRLWQYSLSNTNVLITPHIGGFSPDAVAHVVRFSCERIRQYFDSPHAENL